MKTSSMSWEDHDILTDIALAAGEMRDLGPCPECNEPGDRTCTTCYGRGRLEEFADED